MKQASLLLRSMRPRQWTKNLIVLVPVIFSGDLRDPARIGQALAAFALFCLLSGAVYIVNDLRDVEQDRLHDTKRHRPLASGHLSAGLAVAAAAILTIGSIGASFALNIPFGFAALAYFLLQSAYTFWLKHMVILDVMTIAAGFVLRAGAGAVVIQSWLSPWLLMCAALLALFLGFAKRRHELVLLEDDAVAHRPILEHYSPAFIDSMLSTVTSATIITYAIYTFFSPTAERTQYLMLTVPFVVYGLFRYLYLVHLKNLGGSPEEILLTDVPLMIDIGLWLASVAAVIYFT